MDSVGTVLVTGGAGFIGSAVVRHLVRGTKYRVVNADSLTYAATLESVAAVEESDRYHFEHADITDLDRVQRILESHRPTAVLHLAAETHVDRSIDDPTDFVQTNVVGTFRLLEAVRAYLRARPDARSSFRFCHVSTDEVFGALAPTGAFEETTPYAPRSPYSASKAAADHLVRAWYHTYDLPIIVTNCSNNYGPYQFPEKLIPHMIISALEGRSLPIYGDGEQARDWLFVEDHARALIQILERGIVGDTYLVGGRSERTNLEVTQRICDVLDAQRPRSDSRSYKEQIAFVEDRPGHDRRYAVECGKLERELGWRAEVPFEEGIEMTVRWYLENEFWWTSLRSARYGGDRLGLGA
ncbi:MAG: dTDP-glucose 4,6-dehydratase [marine benthic group bacterium]|nr:dTDP-glucose 4,6-dehydratase [Gemmatimonadota bacterium]